MCKIMMDTEKKQASPVCDNEFKEELLSKLNELRNEKILCDVTLRIEGEDFSAHRCVLSAASPYFRSMFTSGFKENESSVVELEELKSPAAASEALRFIYTGEAFVNECIAQDLVKLADYLLIPRLKTKMSEYLRYSINTTNCLALESFASQYDCKELKEAAIAYKFKNFVSVVKSDDFKALDFEEVKELISHDEIVVSKEEDVYEAVVSWVKHDILSRECLFPELLKCLRLFSMSKYGLRKILTEELVFKSKTCTSILLEGLDFFLFPDNFQGKSLKPRACFKNSNESVVILTGGHDSSFSPGTSSTNCLVISTNHWQRLPTMPLPRTRHGAAVCCGHLFVVGGKSSDPMCSYNPKQNKWISCANELPSPLNCSLTSFNEELYLIGGNNHWKSVDKYDPKLEEWKRIEPMKTGRASHCAVAMGNLIYVLGGWCSGVCHRGVECFDPSANQWTEKPSMTVARRCAGAATSSGKIFVVGGYNDKACTTLLETCEMFDPEVNQWSLVSSPIAPRAACAMVSFDHHLYLFGGEKPDSSKLDSVERYDVQNDKWEIFGTMPEKLACVQATVLLLPKKFIDA